MPYTLRYLVDIAIYRRSVHSKKNNWSSQNRRQRQNQGIRLVPSRFSEPIILHNEQARDLRSAASRFEEPAGRSRRRFGRTEKSLGFRGADFDKKTASEAKKTPKIEYTFSAQISV